MKRVDLPKSRVTCATSSRSSPTAATHAPAATNALTAESPIPPVPPITTMCLPSNAAEVLRVGATNKCLGKQPKPSMFFPADETERSCPIRSVCSSAMTPDPRFERPYRFAAAAGGHPHSGQDTSAAGCQNQAKLLACIHETHDLPLAHRYPSPHHLVAA